MLWFLLLPLAAYAVYVTCIKPFSYWTNQGVSQKWDWLVGQIYEAFTLKLSFAEKVESVYNQFPGERYCGIYQFKLRTLVIKDLDLIKQITIKDFDHFTDHVDFLPEGAEPLWRRNLVSLKGDKWKDMRATLSPAFTTSKMRSMFALMLECAEEFAGYFAEQGQGTIGIELKDVFSRFSNDVIATCAFGVRCDSMRHQENEFFLMGKEATDFSDVLKTLKIGFYILMPTLGKALGIKFMSDVVSNFFKNIVTNTVKLREDNKIIRPDMIHLLMEARKGHLTYEEDLSEKETGFATVQESDIGKVTKRMQEKITDDDITAQALIFFFAGFDSVSTLMTFLAYELAVNPDIQERLQREIDEYLSSKNGDVSYETINKMKYLDMVTSETLRKWPGGVTLDRLCVKPYTIQPKAPGESGASLQPGDSIWIPVYGIHRDPQYYPNPEKFDPERFNEENISKIQPYTYMPFGSGPRSCIGSRFALLETKVVFVHLLKQFDIVVTEKTEIPLTFTKTGFSFNAKNGFWVGLKRRKFVMQH